MFSKTKDTCEQETQSQSIMWVKFKNLIKKIYMNMFMHILLLLKKN